MAQVTVGSKSGTFVGEFYYTTENHNHAVLAGRSRQREPRNLDAEPEIQCLHAEKQSVAQILEHLNANSVDVTKNQSKATIEFYCKSDHTLHEQLMGSDSVFSLAVKYHNISGVFAFVTYPPLLTTVNVSTIKHIFVDGTFALGPQGTQVLKVLGLTQFGIVVPLGYCVTNGATVVHHLFLLEQLAGMGLNPTHVHVDFERAEQQAVELAFPKAWLAVTFTFYKLFGDSTSTIMGSPQRMTKCGMECMRSCRAFTSRQLQ